MQNPWFDYAAEKLSQLKDFPQTLLDNRNHDFVLPADRKGCPGFDDIYLRPLCLQTHLPPVPYVGNPYTADVVVLAANPGFIKKENPEYDNNACFVEQSLKSLRLEGDYPIHYLDARFGPHGRIPAYPGYRWWEEVIGDVVKQAQEAKSLLSDSERKHIRSKIAGVEWLPYHSNSFTSSQKQKEDMLSNPLPSQEFTSWLVKNAFERQAQIIVIWGKPHRLLWECSLKMAFPSETIFTRPDAVRPRRLQPSHFTQSDINRIVEILAG